MHEQQKKQERGGSFTIKHESSNIDFPKSTGNGNICTFGVLFLLFPSLTARVHDKETVNPCFKQLNRFQKLHQKNHTLFSNTGLLNTKLCQYSNNQAAETEKCQLFLDNQDPHVH